MKRVCEQRVTGSFRRKIIVLCITAVLIPLLIAGWYMYIVLKKELSNNIAQELSYLVSNGNDTLRQNIALINEFSMQLLANQVIREQLNIAPYAATQLEDARIRKIIGKELQDSMIYNYAWDTGLVRTVLFYQNENNRENTYFADNILLNRSIAETESLAACHKAQQMEGWNTKTLSSHKLDILFFVWDVRDNNTMQIIGKMVVGVDRNKLLAGFDNMLSLYDGAQVLLFNNNRELLSPLSTGDNSPLSITAQPLVYNQSMNPVSVEGQLYLYSASSFFNDHLSSIVLLPREQVYQSLGESMRQYIFMVLFIMVLFVFGGAALSTRFTSPIKELGRQVKNVSYDHVPEQPPVFRDAEINQLSFIFFDLIQRIQKLNRDVYEKHLLLKQEELNSLLAQINPHFLFNILDVISWNARAVGAQKTSDMVQTLGELMRANLSMSNREKIQLNEELQYIRFYLQLQKERFGSRLRSSIIVGEASLHLSIPKLCIYPLVENAVIHGIEGKVTGGCVDIHISETEEELIIYVQDDGMGFDTAQKDVLQKPLPGKSHGYGIFNTDRRVRLLYGDPYGITIKSVIGEGTLVILRLPLVKEGKEHV